MPAVSTSILVGSVTIPAQSFTANGFACSIPAGTYYLRHSNSNLSLVDRFASAIEDATGVSSNGTTIKRSRLVADSWTAPVDVTWGSATQLRDLLGHTGNLASATSHTATLISPLLWSPGYPGTPSTIPGVSGYPVDHKTQFKADDGSSLHTDFYSEETWQELEWTHIVPSRLRSASGLGGGTFHEFYRQVARLGERFFHYESVTEDTSDSTTDITWGTGLGPYVLREFSGDYYQRRVKGADVSSPLRLPLHLVDEVS